MNDLEKIVQAMIDAGESEEAIASVIKEFKPKKATGLATTTASAGSLNQAENGDSTLDPGSLVYSQFDETYVFDDGSKVPRSKIVDNLRNLDIKLTGNVSTDLYDFKDGKAIKVKENITDQKLLDSYLNKFKNKPLKTYDGQTLDEVVITVDRNLQKAKKVQSQLDFLKPNEEDYASVTQQADDIFIEESELPKRFVRADKFDPGVWATTYPDGYKDYVKKAKGDLDTAKQLFIADNTKNLHASKVEAWAKENESMLSNTSVEGFLDQQEKAAKIIGANNAKSLIAKEITANQINDEIVANNAKLLELTQSTFEDEESRLTAIDVFEDLKNTNDVLASRAKNLYEERLALAEDSNDNDLILDVVKRSYDLPTVGVKTAGATVVDIVGGALKIPEWLYVSIGSAITSEDPLSRRNKFRDMMSAANVGGPMGYDFAVNGSKELSQNLRGSVAKPIDVSDISSLSDVGYWATDLVASQLPNLALMIAAPEVALPILSASATGGKYESMIDSMSSGDEKYKGWQLMAAPLIVGASEYLTESISLGQLKGLKNVFKKSPDALKAANQYIEQNILKGQYIKSTLGEAGGEGINTLSENITDIYMLGDTSKNIWDGVPNALAAGGFMSGVVFKAPAIGAKLIRPFSNSELQAKLQNNFTQFQKISKELNNNKNLSEESKNSLVEAQVKITNNSNELLQEVFDKVDGLTNKDKSRLIEIDKKAAGIEATAKSIYNDSSLDSDTKKLLIDDLNVEYKALKGEKNIITKVAQRDVMLAKAIESGTVKSISSESFDTAAELKAYVKETGRSEETAKVLAESTYGTIFQRADGSQEILINKELAKADNRISTADHEYLHAVLYNTLKDNPQAAINLGTALYNELQNMDARDLFKGTDFGIRLNTELNLIKDRKANFLRKNPEMSDSEASQLAAAQSWEEALTLFSEALVNNEFDDSIFTETVDGRSFLQKIKEYIQRLFGKEISDTIYFNTGQDVINFIRDYNTSFQTGKWGEGIKKLAAEGAKGKLVEGGAKVQPINITKQSTVSDIQDQLSALEDQLINDEIDYDAYEAKISILEKRLNTAELEEAEEAKKPKKAKKKSTEAAPLKEATIKSKVILDNIGNDPKGFNKNDPKIYEVLEGIIKSKSKVFRTAGGNIVNLTNLPGFEMDNMVQETIVGLVPMINKFDPAKNDSLYGYLNSQLANKMRGALKSGKVTEQTFAEDVTQVKGLAAEEVSTPRVEKPKYTKIIDADVFSVSVVNDISTKLVSTIRVLKNKLTAAVGRNQNTSPIIAEIVASISKQADIDIKKAMGGKKDGVLRKFLLNNKKAIIENATTTFLMGKDSGTQVLGGLPIAIQKQVDGRFLSYPEWVGKTIDRETSAARGATSGNQIVRRVPANSISDADYLSFFLEPGGNPLRGRKEALAKEISGEVGLELFVEAIESGDGPIFEAFQNNQELIGEVLADNYIGEVIKQVERGTIKFSMKASKFDSLSREAIQNLLQPTKTDRIKAMKAFENKYTAEEYEEIKKLIIDPYEQVISDVADELGRRNRGFAMEDSVIDILNNAAKSIDGLKVVTRKGAGSDNRTDIVLSYKDNNIGFELKLDKYARLGSFSINDYVNNPTLTIDTAFDKQIKKAIAANDNIKELEKFVLANGGSIKNGKLMVDDSILLKISGPGKLRSKAQVFLTLPADIVYDRYLQKDLPVDYMNFGDLGLFYLKNNPLNLPIEKLEGDIKLRIHFKRGTRAKDGTFPLLMTADPSLTTKTAAKLTEKSKYTLLSEKSVQDMFNDAAILSLQASTEINKNSTIGDALDPNSKTDFKDNKDINLEARNEYIKLSKPADPEFLDKEFNLILERTTGLKAGAVISKARALQLGKGKGKFDYFLPPNSEDFVGLLYKFLGKGKEGDNAMKFFKENLLDPFDLAENAISSFRQRLAENLKILNKELGDINKDISKESINKIEEIGFTPDQAVRVFIWNRLGHEIPDLTKQEKAKILSVVRRDAKLMAYAKELMKITEQFGGYPPPLDTWYAGNSKGDLYQYANEDVRSKYLENWKENANAIFNPKNMIKIEALYGKEFTKNLADILRRMKSGSNRPLNLNDNGSKMLDYINGSIGTIMFLNMRSAVLQTISAVNFLNWHDNNVFKAGATLKNPKNFVKTFMEIMNSDFLKQRRDGLEINVTESEIAKAVEQSKNKAKSIFNSIIKFGYKPTQFADSFAIAAGGTSFLINRTETYVKTGLSLEEAKEKAFADFRSIAEENQQSSRTDRTSSIQASNLGRLVFAFNNTPFQMTRLMKKATLDLVNKRGDMKTNISKMLYYGAIQNIIFFSLQQAFAAMLFSSDEEDREDIDKRTERLFSSTLDSILRGSGLPGALISTAKGVLMEYANQEAKGDWRADHGKTIVSALNFSPPIGSKVSRIYTALKGKKYEKTNFDYIKNKSKIISALTNIPVDRTVAKIDNMNVAINQPIETWKRLMLFAGWDQWSLGVYDDLKAVEDKSKGKKKKSRSEIMKEVWKKKKAADAEQRAKLVKAKGKMSAEQLLEFNKKERLKSKKNKK